MISASSLPTDPRGQLVAVALLLLVVGLVYLFLVAPVLGLYAERQAVLDQRRMLAPRLAAAGDALPALRAQAAALRGAPAEKITLDGSSDAIASANLQSHIEELASPLGVTIGSTESMPIETRGPYRRIGLRLMVSGEYQSLLKLVAALEASRPPLVLDNLQIHAKMNWGLASPNPNLDAALEVYGFRDDETKSAAKP
ncbi:MAG: hypothetical protein JO305_08875 [Alphaproteobacteria bacterium]|nr:hypothetical protein [Alphaproteobacteria bacterium]